MKRVLITGASGLLGRAVYRLFTKAEGWEALGLAFSRASGDLKKVDLTNEKQVQQTLEEFKPSIIIHSAAERRPDEIENQAEKSKALNIGATETICKHASCLGCPVIYISTDYVFDGTDPPYATDAPTNPINKYGTSKLAGERIVIEAGKGNLIVRVAVLYGEVETLAESAVTSLFTTVLNTNQERSVSDYEIKFPTHVDDVALTLLDLCNKKIEAIEWRMAR